MRRWRALAPRRRTTCLPISPSCLLAQRHETLLKDRMRLWKEGVRELVMELCCALHNFRVRLTPWQPMV